MFKTKDYYTDLFQVSETQLERLVEEGLERGGNYCDLYFENTVIQIHQLIDGEVTSGGLNVDYGVGIRVLCGEKTGYAYSESTLPSDMEAAARAASSIALTSGSGAVKPVETRSTGAVYTALGANGGREVRRLYTGAPNPAADRYPILQDWRTTSPSVAVEWLHRLEDGIKSADSRIRKITCSNTFAASSMICVETMKVLPVASCSSKSRR